MPSELKQRSSWRDKRLPPNGHFSTYQGFYTQNVSDLSRHNFLPRETIPTFSIGNKKIYLSNPPFRIILDCNLPPPLIVRNSRSSRQEIIHQTDTSRLIMPLISETLWTQPIKTFSYKKFNVHMTYQNSHFGINTPTSCQLPSLRNSRSSNWLIKTLILGLHLTISFYWKKWRDIGTKPEELLKTWRWDYLLNEYASTYHSSHTRKRSGYFLRIYSS